MGVASYVADPSLAASSSILIKSGRAEYATGSRCPLATFKSFALTMMRPRITVYVGD
jgi:hypothetical protein